MADHTNRTTQAQTQTQAQADAHDSLSAACRVGLHDNVGTDDEICVCGIEPRWEALAQASRAQANRAAATPAGR